MPRIVSLLPSTTEIVCALGQEGSLAGRSHECDYPPSVRDLPACTATRIDSSAASHAIETQVKESLEGGQSLYDVKADVLERLRPDVILTQDLCEVCAVNLRDVEAVACRMIGSRPRIVTTNPKTLAEVWSDVKTIAAALDVAEQGDLLVGELTNRVRELSARANGWGRRPTVACIEWLEPLMAAGNWVPEMVELAGGINAFGEGGKHSTWMTFDDLYQADPDVIVALPCGFTLERTRREMISLMSHPEWTRLKAVRNGRVHIADGNAFFNRPGPRLVEAIEMLAEAIQPAAFCFGHEGMENFG